MPKDNVASVKPIHGLTDAEQERLVKLNEECAEVSQIVSKILRFGYSSFHPDQPSFTNRRLLERELGDVDMMIRLMDTSGDISKGHVAELSELKSHRINPFLIHNNISEEIRQLMYPEKDYSNGDDETLSSE